MLKSRVFLLLAWGVAGFVVGAGIVTAVILLRERVAAPEELPPPRAPMPSWTEEAQQIHRCRRCGRKIIRGHERDQQRARWVGDRIEYFHDACWDEATGGPKL